MKQNPNPNQRRNPQSRRATHRKFDWISISRRNWCSTPAFCSCALSRTLMATMNLLDFSRAKYTLPNLPEPSGLPMSKLSIVHRLIDELLVGFAATTTDDAELLNERERN
jgi:hypothetical protein